jgi:hypothetical protein
MIRPLFAAHLQLVPIRLAHSLFFFFKKKRTSHGFDAKYPSPFPSSRTVSIKLRLNENPTANGLPLCRYFNLAKHKQSKRPVEVEIG